MKTLLAFILSLPLLAFAGGHQEHGGAPAEHGGAPADHDEFAMDSTLDDAETREAGMESDEDAEVRRAGGSDTEERLGREEWSGNTKKGP